MRARTEREAPLTRSTLAARTGCNIETIRYYERIGLLPAPPRSEGGHRRYSEDLLRRLSFVRRCRELGFTIEQTRELLHLVDGGGYSCARIEALARAHVRDIRRRIADLRRFEAALETMAAQCSGATAPHCPIIDALFDPETPVAAIDRAGARRGSAGNVSPRRGEP